jgi:hypothetical protein
MNMLSRRAMFIGLTGLLVAPVIIKASSLMPLSHKSNALLGFGDARYNHEVMFNHETGERMSRRTDPVTLWQPSSRRDQWFEFGHQVDDTKKFTVYKANRVYTTHMVKGTFA